MSPTSSRTKWTDPKPYWDKLTCLHCRGQSRVIYIPHDVSGYALYYEAECPWCHTKNYSFKENR